jgi:16S rRNA (guanine(966)-N(2))-methyltransferase RsmD
VRVIAGHYGGRTLKAPPGNATRPTSDRVREALFSILGGHVRDARVLDLFAGSGALGIEALSRGAKEVTFVDDAVPAIRAIKDNLKALKAWGEIRKADAVRFLADPGEYDLVFLDPPYKDAAKLAPKLSEALPRVLAPGGLIVAESDRRSPLDLQLSLQDERRYGDTLIRIYTLMGSYEP